MTTIAWHDLKGERAESFISIMLLRDFPDGRRRRPTQGDGGIDVIVPVGDNPPRYDIYQIKSFYPTIDPKQRAKVKKSAKDLLETVEKTGLDVEKWHLVVPVDPSDADEAWLNEIFEGTEISAFWKGWSFLEGLAGKYRDVVDFYVNNGQDRLMRMVENALATADLKKHPEKATVSVDDAYRMTLPLFEQLNLDDPHYLYNVSFTNGPFDPSSVPDSVVMSQFVGPAEGPTMRIDVHPKYLLALEDRPIESSFTFTIPDSNPDLQKAVKDFDTYGEDLVVPAEYASGTFTDPLSGSESFEAVEVRIWSPERKRPARIRMIAADSDGRRLASCFFTVDQLTEGPSGEGLKASMVSDSGMTRITQWAKSTGQGTYKGTFNFTVDFSRPYLAVRVRDELRFLRNLAFPNKMVLALEFTGPYTDVAALEEVTQPVVPQWLVRHAEALSELQEYANVPLEVGNPGEHEAEGLRTVKHAVAVSKLLHGGKMKLEGDPELFVHLVGVDAQQVCDQVSKSGELAIRSEFQQRVANGIVTFPDALQTARGITARLDNFDDGTPLTAIAGVEGPAVITVELDQAE